LNRTSNILLILLVITILFLLIPSKWSKFFRDTTEIEVENRRLIDENEKSKLYILELKNSIRNDSIELVKLKEQNRLLDSLLIQKDFEISKNKKRLDELFIEYGEIMKKIEHIKKNPSNKQGEELLQSITRKINK
jgi:hypothetical protein